MKKLIRFIIAIIALPLLMPLWVGSLITIFVVEGLSDYPDWEHYKDYHFRLLIKWYIFG